MKKILLGAVIWLGCMSAEASYEARCPALVESAVQLSICQGTMRFDHEHYLRRLDSTKRLVEAPEALESESVQRLDAAVQACGDHECVRAAYASESDWMTDIQESAFAAARAPLVTEAVEVSDGFDLRNDEDAAYDAAGAVVEADTGFDSHADSYSAAGETQMEQDVRPVELDSPQASAVVEDDLQKEPATTAETRDHTAANQMVVLALWGLLACVVGLLALGATDRVVIFYDASDAGWSIAPVAILLVGYLAVRSLAPSGEEQFATTLTEKLVAAAALAGVLVTAVINYRNAILHNRNLVLGLVVGTFKIALAVFMAISVVGQLARITDSKSTRGQVAGALLMLALVGLLWKMLVNGERVYARRGWDLEGAIA